MCWVITNDFYHDKCHIEVTHKVTLVVSKDSVYLNHRSQLVNVAEHIWQSAEKAQVSAVQAEILGNDELAQKEWQRSVRLFAGAAKAYGVTEPHIPWDEWVAGYATKKGYSSGGKDKV